MNDFQERLQDLLITNNLNRLQLAIKLGISNSAINSYFNRNYYPSLDIAIKLCEYFECSLDYLFGLSDKVTNKYRNDNPFIKNFQKLLKENKLSIEKAMKELNMSEYNYYRWKNGMFPKTYNLIEIAKYFDVSVDYLVGDAFKKLQNK